MTAVIVDTETTGIKEPQVIQLALMGPLASPFDEDLIQSALFKPTKRIDLGALATHHILDEDLVECLPFPSGWALPEGVEHIVGHRVDYDWEAIGKPPVKRICTLELAKYVWPQLDSHKLGAVFYHLYNRRDAREILRNAHDARTDVQVCHIVLGWIVDALGVKTWDELWLASEKARVPVFMTFGKYGPDEAWAKANGGPMRCADVRRYDSGYYSWLMTKCDQVRDNPYFQKALRGEVA